MKITKTLKKRIKKLTLGAILSASLIGGSGCAELNDYRGKNFGEYPAEVFRSAGEDFSRGYVHTAIPKSIGGVLALVNDFMEFPIRAPFAGLENVAGGVPILKQLGQYPNEFLKVTFNSTYGGETFNEAVADLVNFKGKWYKISLLGTLTRNYRDYTERGKDKSFGKVTAGIYGTVVTIGSLAAPALFMGGGGGGGGGAEVGPGPTPPDPF